MHSGSQMRRHFVLVASCLIIILYNFSPSLRSISPGRVSEQDSTSSEKLAISHRGAASTTPSQGNLLDEADISIVDTFLHDEATFQKVSKPKCRVIKVSMLYGTDKVPALEAAVDSHRQHSNRWGCGFEYLEYDISPRRNYSKLLFLLAIMTQELAKPPQDRAQWLMWVDADSFVINPAISPEAFLPPDHLQNVFALLTADHNGLNNGMFYLSVTTRSIDLLTQIADYPLAHPEVDLGFNSEQNAMVKVVEQGEADQKRAGQSPGIVWIPRMWINTYQTDNGFQGFPGHHVVHFPGLQATKFSHMVDWLHELEINASKWEIPLEKTFYKDEIMNFWDEFSRNVSASA